jgi:hypothetical protein
MCRQLEGLPDWGKLHAWGNLSEPAGEAYSECANRALDVRSAAMLFLALNIRHDSTFFGVAGIFSFVLFNTTGSVLKTFYSDEKITDSAMYFADSVERYMQTVSYLGSSIGFKTFEIANGNIPLLATLRPLSQLTQKDISREIYALRASAARWEGLVVTSNSTKSRYDINWRNPLGWGTFGRVVEVVTPQHHFDIG